MSRRRIRFAEGIVVFLLAAVMMSGTVPTPLFPIYAARDCLQPITITVVFAVYAVGILATLVCFGRLSDAIGRRRTIAAATALAAVSMLLFIVWPSLPGLLVARLVSGVSVALMTGASTAYLGELRQNRPRAALLSGTTNMAGLGLGAVLGGVAAQLSGTPLRAPYVMMLVLLLPALALGVLPETVHGHGIRRSLRPQKLSVPEEMLAVFLSPAAAVFTAFSLLGLIAALTGNFLSGSLHIHNHALAGGAILLAFAAAAAAQPVSVHVAARRGLIIGLGLLPCGAVLMLVAMTTASLPVFLAGAAIGGLGAGIAFRSGLTTITVAAPEQRVGEVVSAYFASAYLGLTVPVVGVGILTCWWSMLTATGVFAAAISGLVAVGIASAMRHPESIQDAGYDRAGRKNTAPPGGSRDLQPGAPAPRPGIRTTR